MLLIFPPLAKACEPPAGIARLAASLTSHGIPCRQLDANLEGQLWLLERPLTATDTWSRRALKGRSANLAALREPASYRNRDRYARVISDLGRALALAAAGNGVTLGLADYQHDTLSPVRSADLLTAARHPELNPFFPYFSQRLPPLLEEYTTVGFSLNYLSQALCTFAMIGFVRANSPSSRIILGGGLVTSWMSRPDWCSPFGALVDELIAGAGEAPLLSLLGGTSAAASYVSPVYSALPLADYFSPGPILPYSAAQGCYWNHCSFCPEPAEGNAYHPLPVSRVIADVQQLGGQTGASLLHLLDNAVSPALLRALIQEPPGIPWYGFARIDEQLADADFCHALKRSGCVMLKLGLESGDQQVLDSMNKGITVGMASQVLINLAAAGIGVYCYLLFGTPGEDSGAAVRTRDFVVRHAETITCLNLALFNMPLFGTEAVNYGKELFYDGDLSLYTRFQHPLGWNRAQVRTFIERDFKRHPAIAAIIRNDPPQFGSNHAPLMGMPLPLR